MKRETIKTLETLDLVCQTDILVRLLSILGYCNILTDSSVDIIIQQMSIIEKTMNVSQANSMVIQLLQNFKFDWQTEYCDKLLNIIIETHIILCESNKKNLH